VENKEVATLSGVALGGIVGGLLVSPLGPWMVIGGSTVGATVGGWLSSQVWRQYYVDLKADMERVKEFLEGENFGEAVEIISAIRDHPKFEQQEQHFRSELEDSLGKITLHLALKAETERDLPRALDYYRRARQLSPGDARILESIIRIKFESADPGYEESGEAKRDLEDLLALSPESVQAYQMLFELFDRRADAKASQALLEQALLVFQDASSGRCQILEDYHRRHPQEHDVTLSLLVEYIEAPSWSKATALIEEVERANSDLPDRPLWKAYQGESLLHDGSLTKAEELLKLALESKGFLPRCNLALGRVLIMRKAWSEAAQALAPLIMHKNYLRDALVPLTESLIRAGKLDEAQLHLERGVFRELPEYAGKLRELAEAFERRSQDAKAKLLWNRLGAVSKGPPFWRRFAIVYRQGNPVLLGSGLLGRVFLGRARDDHRLVAIREIPLVTLQDTVRLKRFRHDVELMADLKHDNLVRLVAHALFEGKCLLAMEYCAGGTLKTHLQERLLWKDIKAISLGILAGLTHLHEAAKPVVHRNLSSNNVLFTNARVPKISDFGLSRFVDNSGTSVVTSIKEKAAGYVYTAPEVILGDASVAPRADLYSFGCLLFEMLTGRPPFSYESSEEQIRAHIKEPPPNVAKLAEWMPQVVGDVVMGLLEKSPRKRPESAKEVAKLLQGI